MVGIECHGSSHISHFRFCGGDAAPSVRPAQAILTAFWHELTRDLGGYRPELHYMRGPGPAWHAKNGQVPTI